MAHLLPHTHTQTNHGAPAAHRDYVRSGRVRSYTYTGGHEQDQSTIKIRDYVYVCRRSRLCPEARSGRNPFAAGRDTAIRLLQYRED